MYQMTLFKKVIYKKYNFKKNFLGEYMPPNGPNPLSKVWLHYHVSMSSVFRWHMLIYISEKKS